MNFLVAFAVLRIVAYTYAMIWAARRQMWFTWGVFVLLTLTAVVYAWGFLDGVELEVMRTLAALGLVVAITRRN